MLKRLRPLKRALSSLLATMMVAMCVPFSAVAPAAAAAPAPAPVSAFSSFQKAGPVGMRKAVDPAGTKVNVRWRPGVPKTQIAAAAKRLGFKIVGTSKLGWVQLAPAKRMSAGALATTLRRSGLTTEARASVVYQTAGMAGNLPNDPLFPGQYGLNNTGQTGGTFDADIDAAEAWVSTTGSKNVIVAVVDEGVNISHPDLKNNIWINADEVPNNGIDDDKNGYVDDIRGYDFANDDETVYDAYDGDRHGTHVAGIIGAQGNNGIGGTGVNWNVTIMPVKFLGPGGGDDFAGAESIMYAVDNGAKVINCSWGGEGSSPVIEDAIAYANKKGVLIAAAAGNDGANVDTTSFWPAASDSPNVISVAATDDHDKLADFSNYGSRTVDLAAPGVDVTSTLPAESAGIFVDYIDSKIAYKVMYLPIQVESLSPAADRDAIIERSVKRLGAVSDSQILVVDDSAASITSETQGTRLDIYLDALSNAGFSDVSTWVTDTQGTPTRAAMQGKIVVWFTGKNSYGWYSEYTLDKADQAAIASYLDAGGRLFMASGEMATDLEYFGGQYPEEYMGESMDEPLFLQKYFHVGVADLTNWTLTFSGKAGTPFEGLSASLPDTYQYEDYLWPTGSDLVTPLYDMPYPGGDGPMIGEGELPSYGEIVDTSTPEPPTRESVQTQMQVGKYGPLSGTSMAAPMVSGALALLMAQYPGASADEIEARVLNTTDQLPELASKTVYGGRLNVLSALSSYPGRPTITGPSAKKTLLAGTDTTLTWTPAAGGDPSSTFEAQIGLPYTLWSEGFEGGTLGSLSAVGTMTPWAVSGDATDTHSGTKGAISGPLGSATDIGDGWVQGAASTMRKTITVPEGGATLKFWWKATVGMDQMAEFFVDEGTDGDLLWEDSGWVQKTFELTEGEHTLTWMYLNFELAPMAPGLHMSVDDIELIAHDFTALGTAPAGSRSLEFTVPSANTSDAWLRVRARNGKDSAWAYSRGHKVSTDLVAPGAPTGFSATAAGDGKVNFAWTNPADADFSATRVLWRAGTMPTGPEDASATVTYEGPGTAASVMDLKDGTMLYAAAYAMDAAGNYSEAAEAEVEVVDVTAPSAVKYLEARMIDGGVGVNWMSPTPGSFDSITVLRRTDATPTVGDPTATEIYDGTGAVASDWTLAEDTLRAIYTVYATDASGNHSAPVSVRIRPDLMAPEGMLSINGGDMFTTDPEVSITSEIIGATEMRLFTNGEYDPEQLWAPFDVNTTISLLPLDGWQSVTGEYRDAAGNYMTSEAEIYVDLLAPSKPTSLTAENWNAGVRLSWADPADESIAYYRAWYGPSATGPWTEVTEPVAADPADNTFYVGGLVGSQAWMKVQGVDAVGQESPHSEVTSITVGSSVVRRAGKTRYETAALTSQAYYAAADTVVLVSGTASADALGAAPLAGVLGGPVLLTPPNKLDTYTAAEIDRLGAKSVVIVGGEASVSDVVQTQLEEHGVTVSRIGGADRYEVAARVAVQVIELAQAIEPVTEEPGVDVGSMTFDEYMAWLENLIGGGDSEPTGWDGTVIVANGSAIADALAVGPLAYRTFTPIMLVRKGEVPAATKQALADIESNYGTISRALVVGGPASVSEAAAVKVCPDWRRITGRTRYDIAVNVANYAVENGVLSWERVGIVNGATCADGFAAGPALGAAGGVLLLSPANALPTATRNALRANCTEIGHADLFGGTGALSHNVYTQTRAAIQMPVH